MTGRLATILVLLGLIGWYLSTALFVVPTTEYALETRFSQITQVHDSPGLKVKWPAPIGRSIAVDRRLQVFDLESREYLTRDKKNIIVSAYIAWEVADPVVYWNTLQNDIPRTEARLGDVLSSAIGAALGKVDFSALIATDPDTIRIDDLQREIAERCREVEATYGITILDARLKRLNFPDTNRISVFRRMESERKRIATRFRSEGEEEATIIRSNADRESRKLLAEAERKAEELRGQGEAEAARIISTAIEQDPDFYLFLRKLDAYETILDGETTLIIPDSAPFLDVLFQGVPTMAHRPDATNKSESPSEKPQKKSGVFGW